MKISSLISDKKNKIQQLVSVPIIIMAPNRKQWIQHSLICGCL